MTRYAVDFDGTLNLCESDYPNCYHPNRELFKWLIEKQKSGDKIILWTLRENEVLDNAITFCRENGLEFDAINCNLQEDIDKWNLNPRKISADYYIDDRNLFIKNVNLLKEMEKDYHVLGVTEDNYWYTRWDELRTISYYLQAFLEKIGKDAKYSQEEKDLAQEILMCYVRSIC